MGSKICDNFEALERAEVKHSKLIGVKQRL
uniref:Uncharacterized protein n=1 Tax=viral metagenome TaxID=1070528 RepID=A0A6C0KQ84_9ZZZZ